MCVEEIFQERMERRETRQNELLAEVLAAIESLRSEGITNREIASALGRTAQDITDVMGGRRPELKRLEEMALALQGMLAGKGREHRVEVGRRDAAGAEQA